MAPGTEASLLRRAAAWSRRHLREVLSEDPSRSEQLSVSACGLELDLSRQRLDAGDLELLRTLAAEKGLEKAIRDLFGGAPLNRSEARAALHPALRAAPGDEHVPADALGSVLAVRARMQQRVAAIRADERVQAVVVLGIGGSDLGPRLVIDALGSDAGAPVTRFASNPDELSLAGLDPAKTQLLIVSKSFGTEETLYSAARVREWLQPGLGPIAITEQPARALEYGIADDDVYPLWEWVGGRYSLWSAVGLPIAIALGWDRYEELLSGARAMDLHLLTAPPADNLPLSLALVDLWNRDYLGASSHGVFAYCQALRLLVPWMQQLEMESNGKSAPREPGLEVGRACPVIWGGVGTTAQHAVFQALHQGPDIHPVELLLPLDNPRVPRDAQRILAAHALAQGAALASGRVSEDPDRHYPGNRPSSTLLLSRLDAYHLGALLAAYEHKCFINGWLWGINPFDQWGVELGKQLAAGTRRGLEGDDSAWPDRTAARIGRRFRDAD